MEVLDWEMERRQEVADIYTKLLADRFSTPLVPTNAKSAWAQYSILTASEEERAMLMNKLQQAGIPTMIYYEKPLHLQTAYKHLAYQVGDLPLAEDYCTRIMSLPMHPYLKEEEIQEIAKVLLS